MNRMLPLGCAAALLALGCGGWTRVLVDVAWDRLDEVDLFDVRVWNGDAEDLRNIIVPVAGDVSIDQDIVSFGIEPGGNFEYGDDALIVCITARAIDGTPIACGCGSGDIWEDRPRGMWVSLHVPGLNDYNCDGYDDMVVGAPATGGDNRGAVHIFFGGENDLTAPNLVIDGEEPNSNFGFAVAFAGDVDDDGFADLLVGAPGLDRYCSGGAYIYFGGHDRPNPPNHLLLPEPSPGECFGYSVAAAGDVDGDGRWDVVIGAPNEMGVGPAGSAYVYRIVEVNGGPAAAPPDQLTLFTLDDMFGFSVSGAGDVGSPAGPPDGNADVVIGAPGAGMLDQYGQAFVYLGPDFATVDRRLLREITNVGPRGFGFSVAGGRDISGDGAPDIVVGAPMTGGNEGLAVAYVSGDPMSGAPVAPTAPMPGARFGEAVAFAGGLDGDGADEVLVSALGTNHVDINYSDLPGAPEVIPEPLNAPPYFGIAVAGVGDIDNSGGPDVLIAAEDVVYVFTTDALVPGASHVPTFELRGPAGSGFGAAIAR